MNSKSIGKLLLAVVAGYVLGGLAYAGLAREDSYGLLMVPVRSGLPFAPNDAPAWLAWAWCAIGPLLALAFWQVLSCPGRRKTWCIFGAFALLYVAWPWLCGPRTLGAGLVVLGALWFVSLVALAGAAHCRRTAPLLILPCVGIVSYMAGINVFRWIVVAEYGLQ